MKGNTMKTKIAAIILGITLLFPITPVKANPSDEALIGGAIALGIAGIIASQAYRNRDRHHHHHYAPRPVYRERYYRDHPPRLIYRERPYYDHRPHHHHHWR
jgi:hypothetical protein